ncbi:hypothetical protein RUM43_004307 [Polyplax serrata]|uniref:Coiled-coil domain-containing protein 40 n=1 Tax=Polyplax serrata TaxID=468196 RepID=A0AAN8XLP7_POLSC
MPETEEPLCLEKQNDQHDGSGDANKEQIENICRETPEKEEEDEDTTPLVLEPDHPMMQRFQAALKAHLLKQIDKLSNQVFELDHEIKQKEKEKEETGLELYAVQEEVYRQQKVLEDCETTIESLMKERESLDESVKTKKSNWKEEVNQLNCAKKKEMDLMAELQRLSSLEKQMEKWEKEIESELTVTQRISEKTMYDKNKLIEEKRKMVGREVNHCGKLTTEIENFGIARCGESATEDYSTRSPIHSAQFNLFGKNFWEIVINRSICIGKSASVLLAETVSTVLNDMYLLKLMTAVSNNEADIKVLDGEIELKLEEKDTLSQTLADAAADLQALVTEQKRLMSAWNSVASMISQKNAVYTNLTNDLAKLQDSFRSLNSEIESYKRSSGEEMKKSEKLAITMTRVENDFESGEVTLKILMEKKTVLEDKIASTATMIERTEAEFLHAKMESDKIEGNLKGVRANLEKLCQEHSRLEDEAMTCLQEQICNDKAASHMNKLLKEAREKNRKQEFSLLETENKISQKFLEAEELKEVISRNNEIVKEMNKELSAKEEELKKIEDEIDKCQSAIIQKQGNYATLTRKIEKYIEKTNYGKVWLSPAQQRIIDLEKTNAEIQAKNDKMQSFWLIQQNNNIKLSEQRNEQLKEISLLRKQVLLYEQRVLKTDREFQREKKIENDVNKSISELQQKLGSLSGVLVDRKDYKENLGKENILMQAQFVQNLKDSELEQIRLKDEIKQLETALEELAETMLATQREMLAWERKIQSAMDAKNDIQKQRSSSGEIGQMKAEIHRMEVRYGQLKRAQEKLISDLEQCVFRRDSILDGVESMEKRQPKGTNTRVSLQKKIDTLKSSIRSIRNERKEIQTVIANTKEGHEDLKKCILQKDVHINEMNETTKKMDEQLEEWKLQKCQNLELLIRRQKKCKLYELLKSGKHRLLFKSEALLESEMQKVKNKNSDLISIMEALIQDFPGYRFYLKKIYNTFKALPS